MVSWRMWSLASTNWIVIARWDRNARKRRRRHALTEQTPVPNLPAVLLLRLGKIPERSGWPKENVRFIPGPASLNHALHPRKRKSLVVLQRSPSQMCPSAPRAPASSSGETMQ